MKPAHGTREFLGAYGVVLPKPDAVHPDRKEGKGQGDHEDTEEDYVYDDGLNFHYLYQMQKPLEMECSWEEFNAVYLVCAGV